MVWYLCCRVGVFILALLVGSNSHTNLKMYLSHYENEKNNKIVEFLSIKYNIENKEKLLHVYQRI